MEKIIKYKIFKNNEEFTEYQKGKKISIISVTPYASKLEIDCKMGEIEIAVFVVYVEAE